MNWKARGESWRGLLQRTFSPHHTWAKKIDYNIGCIGRNFNSVQLTSRTKSTNFIAETTYRMHFIIQRASHKAVWQKEVKMHCCNQSSNIWLINTRNSTRTPINVILIFKNALPQHCQVSINGSRWQSTTAPWHMTIWTDVLQLSLETLPG